MKKRKHENTTRLTAKERTAELAAFFGWDIGSAEANSVLAALQAHARETLARDRRRQVDQIKKVAKRLAPYAVREARRGK